MDKDLIQKYVNDFRRKLTPHLKPNIGIEIDIYNCGMEGAVLIVFFRPGGKSIDNEIGGFDRISDVLKSIEQNFIGGNLQGFQFKGTNMMMDSNRIILIKESNFYEWSDQKLKEDIDKIIKPPSKPNKV